LSEQHEVPASTLRVRVFRLVNKLRKCSEKCMEKESGSPVLPFLGKVTGDRAAAGFETKRPD